MFNIYKHSHFLPEEFGHGGNRRTAQINELLTNAGIVFNEAELTNEISGKSKLSLYLKGLGYNKSPNTGNRDKYAIGRYIALFEKFVAENKPQLFIWESTAGHNLLLAEVLYKNNIPVIGLPHNIESLADGARSVLSNKTSPHWLFEEIKYLKYCQKVFTISQEESWLLANTGVNADYLPYYPTKQVELFLSNIRESKLKRADGNKPATKKILLLGTFYNKPTLDGYIDLIKNITHFEGIELNIAGFGSEQLQGMFDKANIKVWGSVSNEVLAGLIVEADCAIIHQQPSSGALTRVPELLIAGLPLLLNRHAARNCYGINGIKIYDSYPELLDILHADRNEIPPVINRPAEEQRFVEYVKSFIV